MIIDVHAHLGNILNPGGGNLIVRKGVRFPKPFNFPGLFEALSMRTLGTEPLLPLVFESMTKSHIRRVAAATLENMKLSMEKNGISRTVCMPIAPYVTFEDLLAASRKYEGILAFTSIDFSEPGDVCAKLEAHIRQGALGLKLHPIIQRIPAGDEAVGKALHCLAAHKLPVLVHTGEFRYYLKREAHRMRSEFGRPAIIAGLVRDFPDIPFIIGHAGLFQYEDVIKYMKGCGNVWVDTSFQSPEHIRKLVGVFGEDKVMFASDWPYGMAGPSIRTVKKACGGSKNLERLILGENACRLLNLARAD